MEFAKDLLVSHTEIDGLVVVDLTVHGDQRGWFKENWQRAKLTALGIPDIRVVQNNISFNVERGVTRGIHAEPWDKWVSVASGSIFCAWVDLRAGSPSYGKVFTTTMDSSKAIFVPRGIGNSYQALEENTVYTYLVNAHWSAELKTSYTFVNLNDPTLGIEWPIPLSECIISDADRNHPLLEDIKPMVPRRTLVTGANGQLGRAVRAAAEARGLLEFEYTDIDTFDFADPAAYDLIDWNLYGAVINCGAYTAVDAAETDNGRVDSWRANATGAALLAKFCAEHDITLVHVSSDYVFDGTRETHYEDEPLSPLGVYGQSKAAGDLAVANCPKHYIVRSSWVIGDGNNFVRTMARLSDRCAKANDDLGSISVVDDQIGRLTFASQMAEAILWLLGYREGSILPNSAAPHGVYNLTASGPSASWYEIARRVFSLRNNNEQCVVPTSTESYYANAQGPIAPRPKHSTLDLAKIESAGFSPSPWYKELTNYMGTI